MLKMIYQLVTIEFKDYFRNPAILFWSVGFPLILATVLGFAFTKKETVEKKIAYISETNSIPNELKNLKEDKDTFTKFIFLQMSLTEAKSALKKGKISLYIEKKNNEYIYSFDPNNQEAQINFLTLEKKISKAKNSKTEILKSKGERYIDFLIPGLLAFGIMNSCMWGTGWSLMDMRMKKLLKRMISTPLPKWLFLISHFISRGTLSLVEFVLLILFGKFIFNVEISGNLFTLFLVFLSGNFAFSGIAIFASSRANNNSVANGVINAFTFPMMLVSGVFFSYHNFPDFAVKIIQYLPLTLLSDSIRFVYLEFGNFNSLFPSIIILNLTGLLFFYIGLKIYKWD